MTEPAPFPGIELDVRELEAPEPMQQIFAELHRQGADSCIRVRHRREPVPLYALLDEAGYGHHCQPLADGDFLIYIWPLANSQLQQQCLRNARYENSRTLLR